MKMSLTWKMNPLIAVWCVILMEGTAIFAANECTTGNYRVNMNGLSVCCSACKQRQPTHPCPDAEQRQNECRCNQGYGCTSRSCVTCKELPDCKNRSQLKRIENEATLYSYYCQDCPKGTDFEVKNGSCQPSKEQPTTVGTYSSVPITREDKRKVTTTDISIVSNFFKSTLPALYLAIAAFIVVLITITVHLLIWKMKKTQVIKLADPAQPQPLLNRKPKEDLDSWSCQYPEEEHGGELGNSLTQKQCV
ncbi:tumor necrosis factor receptor superfamily member 18 [Eleutherodactylus coqui]|uniref:tumor necrosis factor receptor superfamily member 18 n=1 Tax=Eleutherodactylus coqui TaxID=57060 RepID=UPI003461BA28